ncbi:VOC family protein [Ramlibacter henchirensis]|jgi:catechol 2,3-dioxygenase-like lactoylglutathione lyase family enzyme|uniref:VOC family protein n=1 Tax=Ramlibacter henchirensis TaxID=204072 RepID=A0A4Z0BNQ4_9BURK|nr:VOC family protein [Ramlibacter henchirensis]TFZ00947.1 VOC family protein [Ramlibacter henchirensis]
MLSESAVTTMLPVVDMQRARAFYEGKLGLRADGSLPDGKVLYHVGGSTVALFPREQATKAEHTALSFEVRDIASEIRQLEKAGVKFEDYDMPGLKTENHVCVLGSEKAAWFYDTEGNCLCLHEEVA